MFHFIMIHNSIYKTDLQNLLAAHDLFYFGSFLEF